MNQTKSKSHGISQCAKYALLSVHVSAISVAMVLSASMFGAGYHLLGFVITCTRKSENVLILFDDAMSILACGRNQTAKKTRVYFWIGCAAPIIRREKTSASAEYKKKCITFSCHGFEKESNWPGQEMNEKNNTHNRIHALRSSSKFFCAWTPVACQARKTVSKYDNRYEYKTNYKSVGGRSNISERKKKQKKNIIKIWLHILCMRSENSTTWHKHWDTRTQMHTTLVHAKRSRRAPTTTQDTHNKQTEKKKPYKTRIIGRW